VPRGSVCDDGKERDLLRGSWEAVVREGLAQALPRALSARGPLTEAEWEGLEPGCQFGVAASKVTTARKLP